MMLNFAAMPLLAVSQQSLMDGIFVGIAITLGVAAFSIMFNGVLTKVRDK